MRYRNFNIEIASTGEEPYQITARSYTGETAEGEFNVTLPLIEDLEKISNGEADGPLLRNFGAQLHEQLFRDGLRTLFDASTRGAAPACVRLRFCVEPVEISTIPWESLYEQGSGKFLSASTATPLVRYAEGEPVRKLKIELPVNVLIVTPEAARLRLGARGDIRKTFQRLSKDLPLEFHFLPGKATQEAIRQKLSDRPYHVIHFVGNGGCEGVVDHLLLHAPGGVPGYAEAAPFAQIVGHNPSMKLVILDCGAGDAARAR